VIPGVRSNEVTFGITLFESSHVVGRVDTFVVVSVDEKSGFRSVIVERVFDLVTIEILEPEARNESFELPETD